MTDREWLRSITTPRFVCLVLSFVFFGWLMALTDVLFDRWVEIYRRDHK